jgi:hypothetical protein
MDLTADIDRAEKVLAKAQDEELVLRFALDALPNLQDRIQ